VVAEATAEAWAEEADAERRRRGGLPRNSSSGESIRSARWRLHVLPGLLAVLLVVAAPALAWDHWGGDSGGTRFSPLAQITPANVRHLVRAWEFRTGDLETRPPAAMARTKFEATPLLVENSLVFCSPFNEVIARPKVLPAARGFSWAPTMSV
jgi:hypothetical protein